MREKPALRPRQRRLVKATNALKVNTARGRCQPMFSPTLLCTAWSGITLWTIDVEVWHAHKRRTAGVPIFPPCWHTGAPGALLCRMCTLRVAP
ncbi:MAG: hypothetical protein ACE1Y1_02220, partial [Nitrosomonadaceae bacterium]